MANRYLLSYTTYSKYCQFIHSLVFSHITSWVAAPERSSSAFYMIYFIQTKVWVIDRKIQTEVYREYFDQNK